MSSEYPGRSLLLPPFPLSPFPPSPSSLPPFLLRSSHESFLSIFLLAIIHLFSFWLQISFSSSSCFLLSLFAYFYLPPFLFFLLFQPLSLIAFMHFLHLFRFLFICFFLFLHFTHRFSFVFFSSPNISSSSSCFLILLSPNLSYPSSVSHFSSSASFFTLLLCSSSHKLLFLLSLPSFCCSSSVCSFLHMIIPPSFFLNPPSLYLKLLHLW